MALIVMAIDYSFRATRAYDFCIVLAFSLCVIVDSFYWWQESISSWFSAAIISHQLLDLQFIDHSNNYQECECSFASDPLDTCAQFGTSNISLCEEKQFIWEVLKADWLW